MEEVEKLYDPQVGQKVGNGQCGALTSDYMRHMTDGKYQWAGEPGNGQLPPGVRAANNCWEVYTEADWEAIGFEKIPNPSAEQVKAEDTFYISPRPGLPTGHTGIVADVKNGNIMTYEQNVLNAQVVQKLPDENSWSWYGGFDGIVRKKEKVKPTLDNSKRNTTLANIADFQQEEDYMKIVQAIDKNKKPTKMYLVTAQGAKWIKTPKDLDNIDRMYAGVGKKLPRDTAYESEIKSLNRGFNSTDGF